MKEEYISISEFAKRAGVSRQAVYKRIVNDLQAWTRVDNGKKTLNIKALQFFVNDDMSTDSTDLSTIKLLQNTIEILEKELGEKNREIEELRSENRRLTEQLFNLSGQVGSTLQALTQTQLADKIIEGQKLIEGKAAPEVNPEGPQPKKKTWRFWK